VSRRAVRAGAYASARSASVGSIRSARRVGSQHATRPVAPITTRPAARSLYPRADVSRPLSRERNPGEMSGPAIALHRLLSEANNILAAGREGDA
jgi:hypothetical protein